LVYSARNVTGEKIPIALATQVGSVIITNPRITFGDKVRIRSTDATEARGVAGQTGIAYGYTTPSVTGVEVIGNPSEDYAVSVGIEGLNEQFWFAEDLLEFVNHGAGTTMEVGGRRFIRDEHGEWREVKPQ